MNLIQISMNNRFASRRATGSIGAVTFALGAMLAASVQADMYRPAATAGGLQVSPVINGTPIISGSNATLNFTGLQAPYVIQVASNLLDWNNAGVTSLKHPNFAGSGLATNVPTASAFFRLMMLGSTNWVGPWNPSGLSGISNVFAGASKCNGCHNSRIAEWSGTKHAKALDALQDTNGVFRSGANDSCVVCHTVGKGQPGGFVSRATTPHLTDVGCEACHGSANAHININSRQYHPANTVAAEVCGGCHTSPEPPIYNEWTNSFHAEVTESVAEEIASTNADTGFGRQMSCGPCHSGATRLAMLSDLDFRQYGITNRLSLPSAHDGAAYGVTCVVCHDPHSTNIGPHQVRNPIFSTAFYTFLNGSDTRADISTDLFGRTTTNLYYMNTVFATQYVASVQICAQCHNSRGAVWTGTSRSPHYSPQYNILVGAVQPGYLNGTNNFIGPHGLNPDGCTVCHMPSTSVTNPTHVTPNYAGHQFKVGLGGCVASACHESTNVASALMTAIQLDTSTRMRGVVDLLNSWATNKAPTLTNTFATYGKYAWEFTTAGQISNPTNNPAIAGPPSGLQSRIPDLIKKARFNLYLINNDASKGVHNIDYSRYLLRDARTNVLNALQ